MNNASSVDVPPWYKQFWPWFLIALPGSVVIAGIITVVIAFKKADTLVVDSYYKDGLAINRELDLENNAWLLGISVSMELDDSGQNIIARVSGDFPEVPQKLALQLSHPVNQQYDRNIVLTRSQDELFTGKMESELTGRWYMRLSDEKREMWRLDAQWDLSATPRLTLDHAESR